MAKIGSELRKGNAMAPFAIFDTWIAHYRQKRDIEGQYLIEKHAVRTDASIQFLKLSSQPDDHQSEATSVSFEPLISGNPTVSTGLPSAGD